MSCKIIYNNQNYTIESFKDFLVKNKNLFLQDFISQDIQGFKEFVNVKQPILVYGVKGEPSTLYPKIVDYIKENGFNSNEPYYKEYLEAGHILDYSPEEIALVHYNLAYPDENVQPEDLFERLEPQEKEALSNMNIDYTQISTEEARMLLYEPGKAVELMRNFYKLRRGDNTEIFYQIVREKEEDLTNYGCL